MTATEFWEWFQSHSRELEPDRITEDAISELDRRVALLGSYDWEIGPGDGSAAFFALSPRGSDELLRETRALISVAPRLEGWEFLPAKPPRQWNMKFEMLAARGQVQVNGADWECVVQRLPLRLTLRPPPALGLSDEEAEWAAIIIVDGEIGEERRIAEVRAIAAASEWDAEMARQAFRLRPGVLRLAVDGAA